MCVLINQTTLIQRRYVQVCCFVVVHSFAFFGVWVSWGFGFGSAQDLPEVPDKDEDEWDEEAKDELGDVEEQQQELEKQKQQLQASNLPSASTPSATSKPNDGTPEGAGNSDKKPEQEKTGPPQEAKQTKEHVNETPEIKPSDAKPESPPQQSQSSESNQPNKTHQHSEAKQPSSSKDAAKNGPSTLVALGCSTLKPSW